MLKGIKKRAAAIFAALVTTLSVLGSSFWHAAALTDVSWLIDRMEADPGEEIVIEVRTNQAVESYGLQGALFFPEETVALFDAGNYGYDFSKADSICTVGDAYADMELTTSWREVDSGMRLDFTLSSNSPVEPSKVYDGTLLKIHANIPDKYTVASIAERYGLSVRYDNGDCCDFPIQWMTQGYDMGTIDGESVQISRFSYIDANGEELFNENAALMDGYVSVHIPEEAWPTTTVAPETTTTTTITTAPYTSDILYWNDFTVLYEQDEVDVVLNVNGSLWSSYVDLTVRNDSVYLYENSYCPVDSNGQIHVTAKVDSAQSIDELCFYYSGYGIFSLEVVDYEVHRAAAETSVTTTAMTTTTTTTETTTIGSQAIYSDSIYLDVLLNEGDEIDVTLYADDYYMNDAYLKIYGYGSSGYTDFYDGYEYFGNSGVIFSFTADQDYEYIEIEYETYGSNHTLSADYTIYRRTNTTTTTMTSTTTTTTTTTTIEPMTTPMRTYVETGAYIEYNGLQEIVSYPTKTTYTVGENVYLNGMEIAVSLIRHSIEIVRDEYGNVVEDRSRENKFVDYLSLSGVCYDDFRDENGRYYSFQEGALPAGDYVLEYDASDDIRNYFYDIEGNVYAVVEVPITVKSEGTTTQTTETSVTTTTTSWLTSTSSQITSTSSLATSWETSTTSRTTSEVWETTSDTSTTWTTSSSMIKDTGTTTVTNGGYYVELAQPSPSKLEIGGSFHMLYNSNASQVIWSSSDPSIAEIDSDGTVTIHDSGLVSIIAVVADDPTKSSSVILNIPDASGTTATADTTTSTTTTPTTSIETTPMMGDINQNNDVDMNDAYQILLFSSYMAAGDDGYTFSNDGDIEKELLLRSLADVDKDNKITMQDAYYVLLYSSYRAAGNKNIQWSDLIPNLR